MEKQVRHEGEITEEDLQGWRIVRGEADDERVEKKNEKKIKNMEMKAGEGRRSSFFVFAFSLPYRAQT